MPISVSQLKTGTRTIVVPYDDDQVRLTYQPGQLTPTIESKIRDAAEDGDNYVMLETLSKLIVEWDITEDEKGNKPLPHTVEVLAELPTPFLSALFTGIREDMAPKPKSARSSFAR